MFRLYLLESRMMHRNRHWLLLSSIALGLLMMFPFGAGTGGAELTDHLPADPLAAGVYKLDPVEMIGSWIERTQMSGDPIATAQFFEKMDKRVEMSFRDDVLAQLGPEFGFAVNLPPYAEMTGKASDGFADRVLDGLVVVVGYSDRAKALRAIEALIGLAEGKIAVEDDAFTITMRMGLRGPESTLRGRIGKGRLVLSGSADSADAALKGFKRGRGLAGGEDFSIVLAQVDAGAESLTYVNLPKVREWLQEGEGAPYADLQAYMGDEWMGMGLIHASTRTGGGIRTSRFGPEAITGFLSPLSGGNMMMPLMQSASGVLLAHAMDPNLERRKRTMADLRSIGTAIEEFSIDNNFYPSTSGWTGTEALRDQVSPMYLRTIPLTDAWDEPFKVWSNEMDYCIVSYGGDGDMEKDWIAEKDAAANSKEGADIAFCNGSFMQWPE